MTSATTGVVILDDGDHVATLTCLESVELSDDLDLDIVVVDNGSGPEAHQALRAAVGSRGETIAVGGDLGRAAGYNAGLAWLLDRDCHLVWTLDPAIVIEPGTLPELREHLDAVPDCGMVGTQIVPADGDRRGIRFDGGSVDRESGATGSVRDGEHGEPGPPVREDVDYVAERCLLARRAMIEDVGPIPIHYFRYYDDVDWCLRAQASGWRTMTNRQARTTCRERVPRLPNPSEVYYLTRNRYLFVQHRLGGDGETALAAHARDVLAPWRTEIELTAPDWVDAFDELVRLAERDARAGVEGRNDRVADLPPPRPRA